MKSYLILLKEYVKITLATAMEYRASFFIQVSAMIFNDFIWLVFWWIFFQKFQSIDGWGMQEIIMLYAIVTLSYGLAAFFFGNRNKIATIVSKGKLDFYLSLPKDVLYHLLISKSSSYGMGDMLFGIILAIISIPLIDFPLFLILSITGMIIFVSFGILVGSLAFYLGNAEETSRNLFMGLISFAAYPLPIFKGIARIIIFSAIPAAFISGIPVQLLQEFNIWHFLGIILFTMLFFVISVWVFRKGLKRYESGSMITVRV
jgi:ABC-2 type transport system permease protein